MERNWPSDIKDAAKDIFHTNGSVAVHATMFSDQEKLDDEAAVQTLSSN